MWMQILSVDIGDGPREILVIKRDTSIRRAEKGRYRNIHPPFSASKEIQPMEIIAWGFLPGTSGERSSIFPQLRM